MGKKKFYKCLEIIKKGDLYGLEPFYNYYYERLKHVAFIYVKNITDAKKVVSVFMEWMLKNPNDIGLVENPNIWVYEKIRELSNEYLKKNVVVPSADSDDIIVKALSGMTCEEQEICVLTYILGLGPVEMYKLIKKPIGEINKVFSRIEIKVLDIF